MSKKKLIPELRFPEFEGDGEWVEKNLEQVADYTNGRAHEKDIDENGKYIVVNSKFISTEGESLKYSKKCFCPASKGDILMVLSDVPNGKAIAKCFLVNEDNKYSVNQRICKITAFSSNALFLFYILDRNPYFLAFDDGVKQTNLRNDDVLSFTFLTPINPNEQQKIASCLSSLDELIAAHNEKLDALKDHKKGLMQNLFPQEGQTVPNYRFSEFEDDGEWELKPFSKFIKLYRGSSPRPIKEYLTQDKSGVNWIKIGDTSKVSDFVIKKVSEKITPNGAEKSRNVKKGELILANSMSYGSTYLLEIEGCIYDGWFVLREYQKHFDKQFLLQLLNSEYTQSQYKKYAAGGIVQNISSEIVYSINLPKTSKKEQQKIASCLSAVDELISAQSIKIDELKEHKKGLMQGLFPK